jgi:hypothetical protein
MSTSKEAATLVVMSFLVVILIFSSLSYSSFYVFARAKITYGPVDCTAKNQAGTILRCCQDQTDQQGITITYCTDCTGVDSAGNPINCGPRYAVHGGSNTPTIPIPPPSAGAEQPPPPLTSPPSSTFRPPPSTSSEQPPTTATCPDGSTRDASGQCPPPTTTTNNQQLAPPSSKSTEQHHNKGSNLLGGQGLTTKKGNNNDNSPTPPACPTDNSPIPPNCTLKPKF